MQTEIIIPSIKFNFMNKNERIYILEYFVPHIKDFLSKIPVFGCFECDIENGMVPIQKISHSINNLSVKNNKLFVTITILSTPYGKLLQELYDSGSLLCLSPHSLGYVDENHIVHIKELISFNIIDFQNSAFTTLSDIRREKLKKLEKNKRII